MPEPLLSVRDLKKAYNGRTVLNGVDADIFPGEAIFVIGPSGGGKSTFLRCLNLLERPDSGSITFMGQDILAPRADVNRLRKEVGMVFQHFNLFPHLTVLRNITLAPTLTKLATRYEAEAHARALLERIGLADKADAYPTQLSGGQKQRIAIVRALAMRPRLVLFDEPTSALDPEMVGEPARSPTASSSSTKAASPPKATPPPSSPLPPPPASATSSPKSSEKPRHKKKRPRTGAFRKMRLDFLNERVFKGVCL